MQSYGALERQQFIYGIDCGILFFQESETDLRCVGLILKEILKKAEAMEKKYP